MHQEDELVRFYPASDFSTCFTEEYIATLGTIKSECGGSRFQVLDTERESISCLVVAHIEIILERFILDALAKALDLLSIDDLFDILYLWICVGVISLRSVLDVQDDLIGTVNRHGERSTFHRVEIFIIPKILKDLRCFLNTN